MDAELLELLVDTVTIHTDPTKDQWGNPIYGTTLTDIACLIDRETFSRQSGEQSEEAQDSPKRSTTIYFNTDYTPSLGDKIVTEDGDLFVTEIETYDDEHGDPYHCVVQAASKEQH